MTSRLGSVGQRCPPVSGEGSGQGGMLMSDSHYCRAVTTSTSRIHPSPHTGHTSRQTRRPHCGMGLSIIPSTGGLRWVEVEDSMRRSGWDDSAGKEVRIEDRASPQQGDLRLSGSPPGQGTGSKARTCDRRIPADIRVD
ncbi:hypothetical protein PoB_000880600 [Plakobranchus ocellatus]|uniref:Uncharacterized protein n=1 Tax=Plakobranchus ocellatus TaxID=259542 RepID=A0AAV3YIX7_9GAST|nr:hypothetical protein PoB_000880600 [Plakobranchus ocellatus]